MADYTGTETSGAFRNTSIVSRQNRVTIPTLTQAAVHAVLSILKGEVCLAFTVKLITKPDKVLTTIDFGPDNDPNGMLAAVATLGSDGVVNTQFFGAGALLALTAVEDADNTIDLTATAVAAGPATTDLVIDVQGLFLSTSLA